MFDSTLTHSHKIRFYWCQRNWPKRRHAYDLFDLVYLLPTSSNIIECGSHSGHFLIASDICSPYWTCANHNIFSFHIPTHWKSLNLCNEAENLRTITKNCLIEIRLKKKTIFVKKNFLRFLENAHLEPILFVFCFISWYVYLFVCEHKRI